LTTDSRNVVSFSSQASGSRDAAQALLHTEEDVVSD